MSNKPHSLQSLLDFCLFFYLNEARYRFIHIHVNMGFKYVKIQNYCDHSISEGNYLQWIILKHDTNYNVYKLKKKL